MVRIVIVGGGPAGIACAQALAAQLRPTDGVKVVVLEKSSFLYHAVGVPRAFVEPAFAKNLFIPYDNAIPKAARDFVRIVRAVVTDISAETKEVAYRTVGSDDKESSDVTTVAFDYLVIATGSTYTTPINPDPTSFARSTTENQLAAVHHEVERAGSILVVGGGAVGCEVAAEIKAKYPDKAVTIIEANAKLVDGSNLRESFYTTLQSGLERLGVKVILNERLPERMRANSFEKRVLVTDKGTKIESDIQLLCAGFSPVGELVKKMDPALVNERGAIRVNDKLQVVGDKYANMFVLGDASDHRTPKLAFMAGEQGKFLGRELADAARGKTKDTKEFQVWATEACILPLGPNGGVTQLPMFGGIVLGDWTTRMLKCKDYFAGKTWASLGATLPQ